MSEGSEEWVLVAVATAVILLSLVTLVLLKIWIAARGRIRRLELQTEEEGALLRACFDVWVTVDMDLSAHAAELDPRLVRMLNGDPNGVLNLLEHTHRDDRERLRSIVDSLTVGSPVAQKIRVKFVAARHDHTESPTSGAQRPARTNSELMKGVYEVELAIVHYRPCCLVVGITLRDFEPISAKQIGMGSGEDNDTEYSLPIWKRSSQDFLSQVSGTETWKHHRSVSEVSSLYSSEAGGPREALQMQPRFSAVEDAEISCAQSFSSVKITDANDINGHGHIGQVTQSYSQQKQKAFQARLHSLVDVGRKSRRHKEPPSRSQRDKEPPSRSTSRALTNFSEGSDAASQAPSVHHGRMRPNATQLEIAVGMKRHTAGYMSPKSVGLAAASSQASEAAAVGSVRHTNFADNISEAGWKSMATSEIKSLSTPVSEEEEEDDIMEEDGDGTESYGTAPRAPSVQLGRTQSTGPSHGSGPSGLSL
mmetsp:Transcript_63831/g.118654  ORF Transcript_63831/g.118654 Transcript_63831/m.118654 type:complete len:479 (+) Transcript_63831:127-1563(+)